ncbi:MAG: hypothetical protein CMH49_05650 [Myxococcales bacterium]|nr:hypothetical protein [Myxococcales bacterium]
MQSGKTPAQQLAQTIKEANSILVISGAGISVASGIAPFRKDPNAIWEKDITERGTFRYFIENPADSWAWYHQRFAKLVGKQANPAHYAIKDLEDYCVTHDKTFTLVTQNVDGLHNQAGSQNLIEIHGQAAYSRCSKVNCAHGAPQGLIPNHKLDFTTFLKTQKKSDLPHCKLCNSIIRPHVLWFDERYDEHNSYQFDAAYNAFENADLMIAIGTSFSVGITEIALMLAEQRKTLFWGVDLSKDPEILLSHWLLGPCEKTLPKVINALKSKSI